jgi:DNA-binding transcriptional LysR family regulator
MDIRQFRYVTALAQEVSFSAAAKRLHIAQPALSQNIRQVEEELGVKLFERNTRKVALTDAGRAFYREALTILARVENAKRTAQRAARGEIGSLTIGFTTTSILGGELTRRIRVFQQRYPDVRITLEDFTVNKLMNRLRTSTIDVACTEGIYTDESLETQALKPLPVVLAIYKNHPLAKRRHLRLSMLAKEHFILPVPFRAWAVYDALMRFCEQAGFKPIHAGYAPNAPAAVGMAAANLGVALLHELPLFHCPEVVVRRLVEPSLALQMYLVWRKDVVSLPAKNFIHLAERPTRPMIRTGDL